MSTNHTNGHESIHFHRAANAVPPPIRIIGNTGAEDGFYLRVNRCDSWTDFLAKDEQGAMGTVTCKNLVSCRLHGFPSEHSIRNPGTTETRKSVGPSSRTAHQVTTATTSPASILASFLQGFLIFPGGVPDINRRGAMANYGDRHP